MLIDAKEFSGIDETSTIMRMALQAFTLDYDDPIIGEVSSNRDHD